jgi:hypothetical protein
MTNNKGIAHYAPSGRVVCGNRGAIVGVRELERFMAEPKKCIRCAAKLAKFLA